MARIVETRAGRPGPALHEPPEATAELLLTILLGTLRPELAAPTSPDRSPSAD